MLLDCLRGDVVDLTDDTAPTSSELELERCTTDSLLWWSQQQIPKISCSCQHLFSSSWDRGSQWTGFFGCRADWQICELHWTLQTWIIWHFCRRTISFPSLLFLHLRVFQQQTRKNRIRLRQLQQWRFTPLQNMCLPRQSARPNLPSLHNIDNDGTDI